MGLSLCWGWPWSHTEGTFHVTPTSPTQGLILPRDGMECSGVSLFYGSRRDGDVLGCDVTSRYLSSPLNSRGLIKITIHNQCQRPGHRGTRRIDCHLCSSWDWNGMGWVAISLSHIALTSSSIRMRVVVVLVPWWDSPFHGWTLAIGTLKPLNWIVGSEREVVQGGSEFIWNLKD